MDVWVGTSGYSYSDWVGGFYPAGTKATQMLAYYSRQFPLVELNFTFYRPPTPDMLDKFAARTPPGFQFLVKLPRTISHENRKRRHRRLPPRRADAPETSSLVRLAFAVAPIDARQPHRRAWIKTVGKALGDLNLAVEFRHRSWAGPETVAWLADLGLAIVAVDVPDLPGLYPRGWVQSGPTAYIRFHSRNAGNWYRSDKDRYDYDYDDASLNEWVEAAAAASAAGTTERTLFLFNNCFRSQAAVNARRIETLMARQPGLIVTPPPAEAPPEQRSLFGD